MSVGKAIGTALKFTPFDPGGLYSKGLKKLGGAMTPNIPGAPTANSPSVLGAMIAEKSKRTGAKGYASTVLSSFMPASQLKARMGE